MSKESTDELPAKVGMRLDKMETISVVVAASDPVYLEGLGSIVRSANDLEPLGSTSQGAELVNFVREFKPDIVVAELDLDGLKGVDLVKGVTQACAATRFVALTRRKYYPCFTPCLRAGMAANLLKNSPVNYLVTTIRAVHAGSVVIDQEIIRCMLREKKVAKLGSLDPGETVLLKPDEIGVLMLLAQGCTNREIAERLSYSVRNVQVKLSHIFRKLGISSRSEAIIAGLRDGWITLSDIERYDGDFGKTHRHTVNSS